VDWAKAHGGREWPLIGVMAKGSEQFAWKRWKGSRECSYCGRTLRVQDVGEEREYIDAEGRVSERFLWCRDHRGMR
jgi:hypothetical protein